MKIFLIVVGFICVIYASDASYNRGENTFFEKGCSSCHGPQAEGSGSNPKLAHKAKPYLVAKLKYFRSGEATSSVTTQMMSQFAQQLSDQQIEDLATFLSTLKVKKSEDVADDLLGGFGS